MDCKNSASGDSKNPRRVAAGRRNRLKRKGLTPEGRQRLRESALNHKPWLQTCGPRTAEGKRRSASNARARQSGDLSVRAIRSELADVNDLIREMQSTIKAI